MKTEGQMDKEEFELVDCIDDILSDAICPYCDKPIAEGGVYCANSLMHEECAATYIAEMEVLNDK